MNDRPSVAGAAYQRMQGQALQPPSSYHSRRSSLYFYENAVWAIAPLLALALFWNVGILTMGLFLVCLGAAAFTLYRAYWMYTYRIITCDPADGLINVEQRGHWWLILTTSSPDNFSLDDLDLNTPARTLAQRIFDCDTIKFTDGREIRHVIEIDRLRIIQQYRQRLSKEHISLQRNTNEFLLLLIGLTEKTNQLLEEIVRRLGGAQIPPHLPPGE